jgi:serine/threonine-protein phosphatase 2B regulatory subunit
MGNTSSMLTQYDIEEVQDHCNHACESLIKLTINPQFLSLSALL